MRGLVLEERGRLALREVAMPTEPEPGEVAIAMRRVGICGSDLHYYTHGHIGPFVVRAPMVLGHEGAGVVTRLGPGVDGLAVGDRVCMEPGVPDWSSRAAREGLYNLDPAVRFWATPPVHGCLVPEVVHPANLTFRLPEHVSFAAGAFVEPLAIGMQAATRARISPGQRAVVLGAGTIGVMVALSALAAGCAEVMITDVQAEKLAIAGSYDGIVPIDVGREDAVARVRERTGGWGAEVVFEASGNPRAIGGVAEFACPGGTLVLVGMPPEPVPFDIVAAQLRELRIETVFRYAHVFPRAVALLGSGRIDVTKLVSRTYAFDQAVEAFEFAAEGRPDVVKVQIALD